MKKTNLIFRFHNPNTEEDTAKLFLNILIKANAKHIEAEILHKISSEEKNSVSAQKTALLSISP